MKSIIRFFYTFFLWLILWPFLIIRKEGAVEKKLSLKKTIIVVNHYSNIDPFIIKKLFLGKKITYIASVAIKAKLWSRILGWCFDCIYVDPDGNNTDFIRKSIKVLNDGGTICIFPEGFVNPRKFGFLDFHRSYAFIAKKTEANILPLYLYPEGKFFGKNYVYLSHLLTKDDYLSYEDPEVINMFVLSKIMNASVIIDEKYSKNQNAIDKTTLS